MIVYSEKYPGIIVICPECGALLGIDPHKDLYEEKYVYCPLCYHKIDSGIREAEWRFAVEPREEAQPDDKENSDSGDSAVTSSSTTEQDGSGDETSTDSV